MADVYRTSLQNGGNAYYLQNQQRHIARNAASPGHMRAGFHAENMSPSRSPDLASANSNAYGMFNQGHQNLRHGGVASGPAGRIAGLYNFQQQNAASAQRAQQHASQQQDQSVHNTSASLLDQHANYSTHSTPNLTHDELSGDQTSTVQGGQAQQITEHWAEQLKLYKETERAHTMMIENNAPNHYARTKNRENRVIPSDFGSGHLMNGGDASQERTQDRGRPTNLEPLVKRQDWHKMDMCGQGLRVLTQPVFAYTFLNELYIASNKISQIPAAIGALRQLKFLDASNNLITKLPAELGMCVYLEKLLLFDNKIHTLPNEMGSLFRLEMLGIEGNPLDPGLRQEIMKNGTKAVISHLREHAPVPMPPAARLMLDLQESSTQDAERFKVFSYNTLCDKYATTQQYGYTPVGALAWEYRREQILQEIEASNADFLCLQEVDTDSFKEFFSVKLAHYGYKGVFWPKSRARRMTEKEAKVVDGCATFFRASKYILLDKQVIEFGNLAINRPDMKNQSDIFNRVGPLDHISVVTFFENRLTGSRLILVNAHIFWEPAFADVKVVQTAVLVDNVAKFADKYASWPACTDKKAYVIPSDEEGEKTTNEPASEPAPSQEYKTSTQLPLIICGDFNSTSDSGVYELLANGSLSPTHRDYGSYKYGNLTRDGAQHPFSLRSSYANLNGTSDAMPFTNYTPGFTGVIDYIWYSTNALEVTSLLGPVDSEYMKRVPGFPNYHFPSDHLALLAEFAIKSKKEKKPTQEADFGPGSRAKK